MKQISLPLLQDLRAGSAMVDLLEFYLEPDATTAGLRMALLDSPVLFEAPGDSSPQTYLAAGPSDTRFRDAINEAAGELNLLLPDVDRILRAVILQADLGGSLLVVRRTSRVRTGSVVVFEGKVAGATVELSGVTIQAKRISADANETSRVPKRRYQNRCNNGFGDPWCGAVIANFAFSSGSVGAGSNQTVLFDSGFDDEAFAAQEEWLPSEVRMTSGANRGRARPCSAVSPCRIDLRKPFVVAPEVGDTFILQRLCLKTPEACTGYNNYHGTPLGTNGYGGFEYQPKAVTNLRRQLL